MKKIKRILIVFFAVVWFSGFIFSSSELAEFISHKKWGQLTGIFNDDSHKILKKYFDSSLDTKFVIFKQNKLTYKAKFLKHAEIGTITYGKTNDKYRNLKIVNQISPLYYIDNFKIYPIQDKKITLGEAQIYFQQGFVYESMPFKQVIFFTGKWNFTIEPTDPEEKATLQYLFNKDRISTKNEWGIFVLQDKSFLEELTADFRSLAKTDDTIAPILEIYKEYFGINIRQFDEFWFLPFSSEDNLVISRKDKKELYLYDFNPYLIPDTQLRTSKSSHLILAYNAIRQAKITLARKDKIDNMKLDLFYNPETNFISGTINMTFKHPASFRTLKLAEGLKIRGGLNPETRNLSVLRKHNLYYFLGPDTDSLSFFYRGNIQPDFVFSDVFKQQRIKLDVQDKDPIYFLSRTQDYYPNPGIDFTAAAVSVSVPLELNCLVSGQFKEKNILNRNIFRFNSPGIKGISLACGKFEFLKTIRSKVPIRIYTPPFSLPLKYFSSEMLKESFDFLVTKYGKTVSKEINLLLQKGISEGGYSNQGFIFFNYNPDRRRYIVSEQKVSVPITKNSPINLRNRPTDYLIHELAHQWWGGIVSWDSYRDIWITEGLAQFSLLYYLERTLTEKRFNRVLKKIKRWIYQKNEVGPIIYGRRILLLDSDTDAFQTIVYNKTAFIFLMLKDIMGEQNFLKSVRLVLEELQYRSINSQLFIKHFSQKEQQVSRFLTQWLYSRRIPRITIQTHIKDNIADIQIEQEDTDFIFPLRLKINTRKRESARQIVVDRQSQHIKLTMDSKIKSLQFDDERSLVKIIRMPYDN